MQARIDVQGENFLENQKTCRGEINVQVGFFFQKVNKCEGLLIFYHIINVIGISKKHKDHLSIV